MVVPQHESSEPKLGRGTIIKNKHEQLGCKFGCWFIIFTSFTYTKDGLVISNDHAHATVLYNITTVYSRSRIGAVQAKEPLILHEHRTMMRIRDEYVMSHDVAVTAVDESLGREY